MKFKTKTNIGLLTVMLSMLMFIVGINLSQSFDELVKPPPDIVSFCFGASELSSQRFPEYYVSESLIDTIARLESSNGINLIGDGGKALGVLQIWGILVDDHNRIFDTKYNHVDVYNDSVSYYICRNMLTYGSIRFYNKYGNYPSNLHLLKMWNGNIYEGHLYECKEYISKYKKLKNIK
jgi:hypothetical protein